MRLQPGNPMRSALASVLVFEVVVFWLAFAGMVQVSGANPVLAAACTAAASILCIAATMGLSRGWGYPLGHLAQVAAIALGVLTPWMYAMGTIFAIIWVMSFIMGQRIDARRAGPETEE